MHHIQSKTHKLKEDHSGNNDGNILVAFFNAQVFLIIFPLAFSATSSSKGCADPPSQ